MQRVAPRQGEADETGHLPTPPMYQVLIITITIVMIMMYDDQNYDELKPTSAVLFTKPSGLKEEAARDDVARHQLKIFEMKIF